ncbi:MAG: DNA translocase FtsK [Bacilli bacterium]|jgi:S-DNA-T family DNA segregation ATPase FtsK/SpoIIIE|nr:DNA translocase FtsK [Bacilli bacterium]
MAKKKKSKASENESFQYSVELTGLILILIGLIGFGFGPVGSYIKKFAMFLVGGWAWIFLLIFLLFLGSYMLFKRKLPRFLSQRLIGLYVIIIVILVASHFGFIENCKGAGDIFQTTISKFMDRISTIGNNTALFTSGDISIEIGGGMIGAIFAVLFSSLFGLTGTKIVSIILVIFGSILLFNVTLADILNKIKDGFKTMPKERKEEKVINHEETKLYDYEEHKDFVEPEMPRDDKIVITSMDELKNIKEEPVKESLEAPTKSYEINSSYALPPLSLLDDVGETKKVNSNNYIRSNRENLERVLNDFQIKGQVVEIHIGPAVTQYEVKVPSGTKVSRISGINKEIALALAAKDVRIQAPIPGKSTIGIEIPNPSISMVKFKEVLSYSGNDKGNILVALGKDIMGKPQLSDLSKMPHLLIAGSTGSGKSVCTNTIICSILMRYKPDEVKLMLVDPKKVELSNYNGVPHLLCPVVSDPKKASVALQKLVAEMEKRYDLFSEKNVKNIAGYNDLIDKENKNSDNKVPRMHYIVAIIDELADLMLVASKEVEDSIMRITQMARAAGIHLIVATQRPSTDVITGVVKANIPSRIAFAVASNIDSRTILDSSGAEKLLGKGDMLYLPMGENVPTRIQGCFINDDEIKRIIDHVCKQQSAHYDEAMENLNVSGNGIHGLPDEKEEFDDPLYNEIVEFAIQTGKVSTSLLQRRFRLGYNRAARVVDLLEERGICGPANGSKPREVLVKLEEKSE